MFLRKRADNANTTVLPPNPVALTASGDFDGNDGKWSSFYINIGDDGTGRGQNFKVLPSTSSPITLVPQQANWCNEDCAGKRGVQIFNGQQPLGYDSSKSAAWSQAGLYTIPLPDWWSGNHSLPATWGSDNVGLGESSKTSNILAQQWVVESQVEEFYMGLFGLAAGSVGPGSAAQKAPFITNFYGSANLIPSRSYGYTAGASYRNNAKGVVGDLVLGGYDQSRAKISNGVSINMPNDRNNTLVVGVQSIIYAPDQDVQASSNSFTAGSSGFFATIDSTLPYLWLPDNICDQFAKYFQLDYDDKSNLYTVNASAHQNNKQQNATVSFKIGSGTTDSNQYASIVLPYDAFDLQIDVPLVDNVTNYFPLKKSPNGIFVLGRTFLQESYIVVDYERANFTVAPAIYNDPMPDPSLVSIYNKTYAPPIPSPTLIPSSGGGGLSGGAIAGIVVGIVVVILGAALGFFFWWKRRRNDQVPPYTEKPSEIDTMVAGTEVKHRRVSELDSEPPGSPKPSTVGGYYGDRDQKDVVPFPPINEMESPPAELYSPPPPRSATPQSEAGGSDYFIVGNRVRRRGATRESSQNNTPGTPAAIAELPGDDGKFQVGGMHFDPVATPKGSPVHSRGPSDSSLQTNIDEVMKRPDPSPSRKRDEGTDAKAEAKSTDNSDKPKEKEEGKAETGPEVPPQRRPSQHTRGLSDDTIQSDSTAVSQPTPEELEQWAMGGDDEPRRPLSQ